MGELVSSDPLGRKVCRCHCWPCGHTTVSILKVNRSGQISTWSASHVGKVAQHRREPRPWRVARHFGEASLVSHVLLIPHHPDSVTEHEV